MTVKPTSQGWPQAGDLAVETALPVTANISRTDGQTVLSSMDTLFGNVLEDRSSRFVGGGSISLNSGGTTLTFSDRLDFVYNNAGTQETITSIIAAAGTLSFSSNNTVAYITVTKGSPGSAILTSNASSISAATTAQEVFLLAMRRDDLSPATQRVYLYSGLSLTSSQTLPPGVPSLTTFSDANFVVYNSSDATKELEFSLGGNTTGKVLTVSTAQTNTETLAIPNVGSGDSFVTNATSATLTNKTLTSPILTTPALGTPSSGNLSNCTAYPIVVPGTSSGLVSASGLTGNTTGSAISAGFVGEVKTANANGTAGTISSGGTVNLTSFSLTAGIWLLNGGAGGGFGTTAGNFLVSINSTSTSAVGTPCVNYTQNAAPISVAGQFNAPAQYINISSTTTFFLNAQVTTGVSVSSVSWSYLAVRIA